MPRTGEEQIGIDSPLQSVYSDKRCTGRSHKTECSRRSKLFSLRLTPGEFACEKPATRKPGVTVAEMFPEGADLCIKMRGRDGSPKKETKK